VDEQRTTTITVRWRAAAALLPAAVLAASGLALSQGGVSASGPALPTVPDVPLTRAVPPAGAPAGRTDIPPVAPALVLPQGVAPGSSQLVPLDHGPGIPAPALAAYRSAAASLGRADPGCHLDWSVLGAIGRVESDHARFGGNALDRDGIARPGIIGIPLDGRPGTALVPDSDDGRWDRDTVYDRAVGPMQFIPGTWRSVGVDGDGDGRRDPQSMPDAATSAGVYLCSGAGDLRQPGDLYAAVRRYNNSDSYARTVMAIADAYARGVTELPADQLPAAQPAEAASDEPAPKPVRSTGPRGGSLSEGTDADSAGAPAGSSPGAGSAAGSGGSDKGTHEASAAAPTSTRATGTPTAAPTLPSLGSAVASATSLVTSVVTVPGPLDVPVVDCLTDAVADPQGLLTQLPTCPTAER